jgi:hypothetical protein
MSEPRLHVEANTVSDLLDRVAALVGDDVFRMWYTSRFGATTNTIATEHKQWHTWESEAELASFYTDVLKDDQRTLIDLVVENGGKIPRKEVLKKLGIPTMKLAGIFSGIVNNAHSRNRVSPIKRIREGPDHHRIYSATDPKYLDWLSRIVHQKED